MIDTKYKGPVFIVVLIVVAIVAYGVLTMRDDRDPAEKIGDAIHDLPHGLDKAGRQLEDRTPGQKLGDRVKDTGDKIGDKIKENTDSQ